MAATTSLLARAATAISDRSSLPIRAAAAATVAVGALFGAHIASGQQLVDNAPPSALGATVKQPAPSSSTVLGKTLDTVQCRFARAVTLGVLTRHTGISAPLAQSFGEFSKTCDLRTQFHTVPGTGDDAAFGEFNVLITAIRMTPAHQLEARLQALQR